MEAYHYSLTPTGCAAVDKILSAVAWIENAAKEAAAENARLRSALEFYADEANYESRSVVEGGAFQTLYPEVDMDMGARARAALGGE